MYFFWGGSALSWMRYMTLYSFRKFNPDWEMILCLSENTITKKNWDSYETQDFYNYVGSSCLEKISELSIHIESVKFPDDFKANIISPVHESDLYRYYKLYNDGGFYSDMDVLYFRPIDDFYNSLCENNTDTVLYHCPSYAAIGFLAADKDNCFYKDLFNFATSIETVSSYQAFGVGLIYQFCEIEKNRVSIDSIGDILRSKYKSLNIYSIPDFLVYQYDWTEVSKVFSKAYDISKFNQKAIGYHWYAGSPVSQGYNKLLNENNYREYKTTFSELVKGIL
jgi:hypothetical protein